MRCVFALELGFTGTHPTVKVADVGFLGLLGSVSLASAWRPLSPLNAVQPVILQASLENGEIRYIPPAPCFSPTLDASSPHYLDCFSVCSPRHVCALPLLLLLLQTAFSHLVLEMLFNGIAIPAMCASEVRACLRVWVGGWVGGWAGVAWGH